MENKHTPGPWEAHDRGIGWEVYSTVRQCVVNDGFRETFTEADAHLIAAAPDLLEALKIVSDEGWIDLTLTEQDSWLRKAALAIAKAEGK